MAAVKATMMVAAQNLAPSAGRRSRRPGDSASHDIIALTPRFFRGSHLPLVRRHRAHPAGCPGALGADTEGGWGAHHDVTVTPRPRSASVRCTIGGARPTCRPDPGTSAGGASANSFAPGARCQLDGPPRPPELGHAAQILQPRAVGDSGAVAAGSGQGILQGRRHISNAHGGA